MQRLLTNVCMVLVAASKKSLLEGLAILADKIMEVALPFIANVATPPQAMSEVDSLRAENASLQIRSRLCRQQQGINGADRAVGTEANCFSSRSRGSVGTIAGSAIPLENAPCGVQSWKTDRSN